jgi:hypothetical protein
MKSTPVERVLHYVGVQMPVPGAGGIATAQRLLPKAKKEVFKLKQEAALFRGALTSIMNLPIEASPQDDECSLYRKTAITAIRIAANALADTDEFLNTKRAK